MRDQPELEPIEPQIAHIGGRRSAVLGALVVIGVLVAMVWIGISGRSEAPKNPPVVAIQPTAGPASPQGTVEPIPAIPAQPVGPVAQAPDDVFGAYAELGFNQYITILAEPEPGHLVGRIEIPVPPPATEGTLVFQQFSAPGARGRPVPIALWPLNVETLAADSPVVTVVDASPPARDALTAAPRPVQLGYHITVTAQRQGSTGLLTINVQMGPGHQIVGDDGIFGWPTVALLPTKPTSYPVGEVPDIHRPDGGNQCRWYQPTPGSDEADCLSVPY